MDGGVQVSALDTANGSRLWNVDLKPEDERGNSFGGGVAYWNDRLYVSTGYAQILALGVALAAGCQLALCRRFSASGFLPDVRRYGCTLFPYVGSPFAYVMATPERPDDADTPLRVAYGNEAPRQYVDAFARRFGCRVVDGYGASEVGASFAREDGDPPGALGRGLPGMEVLDEQGQVCARCQGVVAVSRQTLDGPQLNPGG